MVFLFAFCVCLKAQILELDKKESVVVKFKEEKIGNKIILDHALQSVMVTKIRSSRVVSSKEESSGDISKNDKNSDYHSVDLFKKESEITTQSGGNRYFLIEIDSEKLSEILNILNKNDSVEYAEHNQIISIPKDIKNNDVDRNSILLNSSFEAQSSDPGFSNQYYYTGLNIPGVMEHVGEDEILIAIVDSGIDIYHEDLQGKIAVNDNEVLNGIDDDFNGVVDDIYGYSFHGFFEGGGSNIITDGFGHGTHISGIIASEAENGLGIKGINPNVKLLAVPFLNGFGFGTQVDAARAIQYSVDRGAKIINCSWGYTSDSSLMKEAFEYAFDRGVIVIAAVGNGSSTRQEYPAAYAETICVGSINSDGERSSFSSYGDHLDFLTYGENIYSLLPNDNYAYKSGSSQSTAIVTGLVSGLMSKYPELSQEEVVDLLKRSSVNPEGSIKTEGYGYGALSPNLLAATFKSYSADHPLSSGEGEDSNILSLVANFPNPVRNAGTSFGFQSSEDGDVEIVIYDLFGNELTSLASSVIQGYNTIPWEGTNFSGQSLPNGTYFYVVKVSSSIGQTVVKDKLSIIR
jgi:subtilisin family serine protease